MPTLLTGGSKNRSEESGMLLFRVIIQTTRPTEVNQWLTTIHSSVLK